MPSLRSFSILLLPFFLCFCIRDEGEVNNSKKVTIEQGVWGEVQFWEGNFMPGTGPRSGTITRVVRQVLVHEPTNHEDCIHSGLGGSFAREITSELIAQTNSDDEGFFQFPLEPGKYSVFILEDSLFYGNRTDSEGHIESFEVLEGETTKYQFIIDYQAAY